MFPSPYGECSFQSFRKNVQIWTSVIWFPSPYGECSFQSVEKDVPNGYHYELFPSPYGECSFQRGKQDEIHIRVHNRVSVPLRGMLFPEIKQTPAEISKLE